MQTICMKAARVSYKFRTYLAQLLLVCVKLLQERLHEHKTIGRAKILATSQKSKLRAIFQLALHVNNQSIRIQNLVI